MKKGIFNTLIVAFALAFSLSGCVEHRYYHENHRHSDGYYHRHHRSAPGIDINIHN